MHFSSKHGRLYGSGRSDELLPLLAVPGAVLQETKEHRHFARMPLTVESLRTIREVCGWTQQEMVQRCDGDVLRWAVGAKAARQQEVAMHEQLATGWRRTFPWADHDAGLPPFTHQRLLATVATALDGTAFLAEMGTGKTRAACEAAQWRVQQEHIRHVLVLCPKSVQSVWVRQARRWQGTLTPLVIDERTGKMSRRLGVIEAALRSHAGPTMVIVNYELVSRNKMAFAEMLQRTPSGLLVDEGHRLKNPEADRTRAIMAMAMFAPWRLVLTGSLVLQGAQDVWAPWMVVDRGLTFGANYVSFRDEWLTENPYTGKLTLKPGMATLVGQRLRRRGVRLRKEDCMDLPPKVFEPQLVRMSEEQWAAYTSMAEELLAELEADEDATAATQLVALLRLTQITSGFLPTDDGTIYRFPANPKLEVLRDVVQDIREEERAVLVWARYREDVTAIATALRTDGHRVGTIMGARTAAERTNNREVEERFERGDFEVLVGIPEAGGLGLNLQRASYAVYYSQGYSLEGRQQSEDRCHRAGSEQHAKVTYIDLMCEETIDEEVLAALRDKKAVQEAVVDLRGAVQRVILARAS